MQLAAYLLVIASVLVGVKAQAYDYVIAGAGTSGLLLAIALSSNPNVTVAVLEAGSDARSDPRITIPEDEGQIQGTIYDWNLTTSPQSGLYNGAVIKAARGKVVGGTSAMHWMIWNQASTVEYDSWQNVLGIPGWNWSVIDAARKSAESFTPPPPAQASTLQYNASCHGSTGPIHSTMEKSWYSLYTDYVIPSLKSLGVAVPQDKDNGITNGVGFAPLSIDKSSYTRSYSGSAWTAVQSRPNLQVIVNATVSRILWSSTTSPATAKGVEYIRTSAGGSTKTTISAKRQVIISAGSLQSPQLLELSGIGNTTLLASLGISTVVNLPAVGSQLQDHTTYAGAFRFNVSSFTGGGSAANFMDYVKAQRFLSTADYQNATSMLSNSKPPAGVSQISWRMFKTLFTSGQPLIELAWYYNYVTAYLLHPLSSGSVHITSNDVHTAPRIDPGYNSAVLANGVAWDLWLLSKAVNYLGTTIASSHPLAGIDATYSLNVSLPFSDFQARVHQGLGSGAHFTGGCIMSPQASGGVVDENFLVYGTSNVRVVDLSVVPYSPGQHPMGLAYAMAMRAASIMLSGH